MRACMYVCMDYGCSYSMSDARLYGCVCVCVFLLMMMTYCSGYVSYNVVEIFVVVNSHF